MKMVKSLLLGSAAGLVAVTAGQAADLPVKARPVQYVKVCSLYGAGFYYMPGTDMCIKIGGWVRAEVTTGINGSSTAGIFNNDLNARQTNNLWTRERGYITADAREQTAYGVARGYIAVGISTNDNGQENPGSSTFSSNRAFVQWAGFTAGLSVSFYDFYPAAAYLYRAGNIPNEDTGDGGWWVWGYTAQFGGGFSATLSAEERRTNQIIGLSNAALPIVGTGTGVLPGGTFVDSGGYGGWQSPDVVGNLRVDQAWGSAQVSGALHQLNPLYYNSGVATGVTNVGNGHPGDEWGWAVSGGIKINTPFISPGDNAIVAVSYTQGATKYLSAASNNEPLGVVNGGAAGYGVGSDCVYAGAVVGAATGTSCLRTSAWEIDAAYEHYWTPQWHESFVVNYMNESYGSQANALLCSAEGGGNATGSFLAGTLAAAPGCNNNYQFWGVGSRLQWDVTKSFYIGVEALYQRLNSATAAGGVLPVNIATSAGILPSGATSVSNESNWTFTIRMHKDFLP